MRTAALIAIAGLVALTVAAVLLTSVDSEGRPGTAQASHGNVDVAVGSNFFGTTASGAWNGTGDPGTFEETTIHVGDSVTWTPWSSSHTVTGCDPNTSWADAPVCSGDAPIGNSGGQGSGSSWGPVTFSTVGEYPYLCTFHPGDMRGKIVVLEAPTPTPTPSPTPEPSPQPTPQPSPATATPTPAAAQPAAVPAGGGEPPSDGGASVPWWWALAAGGLLLATATLALRRLRR